MSPVKDPSKIISISTFALSDVIPVKVSEQPADLSSEILWSTNGCTLFLTCTHGAITVRLVGQR